MAQGHAKQRIAQRFRRIMVARDWLEIDKQVWFFISRVQSRLGNAGWVGYNLLYLNPARTAMLLDFHSSKFKQNQ
jgi:hypothetical protein